MKKSVMLGLLLSVSFARAVIMDEGMIVGSSMKDFVLRFVPQAEQQQFVKYYEEFSKMFENVKKEKQEATRVALFKKAMMYLHDHDAKTHSFIVNCIQQLRLKKDNNQSELENLERFLTHCGVYADFVELKGMSADLKQLQAFADDSFGGFLNRIVASHNHAAFTRYYEDLSARLTKCDEKKKIVTYKYLFGKAMSDLESAHADWHSVLMPYGSPESLDTVAAQDMATARARLFLRRYGAHQEFLEITGQANQGIFAALGSVCSSIGKTISGWFGSIAA